MIRFFLGLDILCLLMYIRCVSETNNQQKEYKMEILTPKVAKSLRQGQILSMNNNRNADGTCVRWRVNGAVKTWKTRPNEFKVPVKHGMYDFGYVTQHNYFYFHINGTCEKC